MTDHRKRWNCLSNELIKNKEGSLKVQHPEFNGLLSFFVYSNYSNSTDLLIKKEKEKQKVQLNFFFFLLDRRLKIVDLEKLKLQY